MELETMFSDQKWNILKCLSSEKSSPLQLAEHLDTSMANISQQLRLLEASNLVKKEKIRNRDKGKPRTLFSLKDDYAYLISFMDSFAHKRLMKVSPHHKIILKIWFIENQEFQQEVEKLYWALIPHLGHINAIAVDEQNQKVILITDKVREIGKLTQKFKRLSTKISSKKDAESSIEHRKGSLSQPLNIIFDPKNMIPISEDPGDTNN